MECKYRPRLSVELEYDTHQKLRKYFPHGTIKIVFGLVVEDLIEMIEKYGAGPVLGAFIEREIKLEDVIRGNNKGFKNVDFRDGIQRSLGDCEEGEE